MQDLRKAIAEQFGGLMLANLEMAAQLGAQAAQLDKLGAEVEQLKATRGEGKQPAEGLLKEQNDGTRQPEHPAA